MKIYHITLPVPHTTQNTHSNKLQTAEPRALQKQTKADINNAIEQEGTEIIWKSTKCLVPMEKMRRKYLLKEQDLTKACDFKQKLSSEYGSQAS